MNILVFNTGSSSLTYKVWQATASALVPALWGKAHRLAANTARGATLEHHDGYGQSEEPVVPATHAAAVALILRHLAARAVSIDLAGHRIVNGGHAFDRTTPVSDDTVARMRELIQLAPVHNAPALAVIESARAALPATRHYLTFDTVFHASLRPEAYTYALPAELRGENGFRKFGFHGLSYQSVSEQVEALLGDRARRMIVCHLGTGGSSVAAIARGRSVDASMGYTPLAGLVMSTRSGDVDPAIPTLLAAQGYDGQQIDHLLNKQSGLAALSGFSSDMREIVARYEQTGDEACGLAIDVYVWRLRHYIGAYMAALDGLDVLAFTDDVGLQVWQIRERACAGMKWAGIRLDAVANRAADPRHVSAIHDRAARVQILVVPNDEERVIAEEGIWLYGSGRTGTSKRSFEY
jgi:acetate kinase